MALSQRNYRTVIYFAILTVVSLGGYLLSSSYTYRLGFPLDDAWIHQTYARNLVLHGEWAFVPGVLSSGSTSPLWSGLLAIGHALNLGPYLWTFALGWGLITTLAVLGSYTFRLLCSDYKEWSFLAGILLLFEWHLIWAGASGMETLMFAVLALFVLTWLLVGWGHWFVLGLLIGLSVWVRPDGITLLGPAILVILFEDQTWKQKIGSTIRLIIGFLMIFCLYILFNRLLSGVWWPNTFYAKQAEYAIERLLPLWVRIMEQVMLPIVGVGLILLPGFIYYLYNSFKNRSWAVVAGAIWAIGYLFIYALRLPVTYQHGRYVIPMMPVFFLWSFAGFVLLVDLGSSQGLRRVFSRAWLLSAGLVLIIFWFEGARAYSRDVAVIESEMVKTANWIADNTEPNAIIAAHDIGALGYYGERQIIDLAGLVSPEVIPFIRDEGRLVDYLDEREAVYLVTFPGWYPRMVKRLKPIYRTDSIFSPAQGGENMYVYRWSSNSDQ